MCTVSVIDRQTDRQTDRMHLMVACSLCCLDCAQVSDLAAGGKQTPLGVRHDKHRGFFVEGLTEQPCATCQEALVFMHKALTTRHIRSSVPLSAGLNAVCSQDCTDKEL